MNDSHDKIIQLMISNFIIHDQICSKIIFWFYFDFNTFCYLLM